MNLRILAHFGRPLFWILVHLGKSINPNLWYLATLCYILENQYLGSLVNPQHPWTYRLPPDDSLFANLLRSWYFPATEFHEHNCHSWLMPATVGTLYLWNSTISHSVPELKAKNDRYSLSFNTFVRGIIGEKQQANYVEVARPRDCRLEIPWQQLNKDAEHDTHSNGFVRCLLLLFFFYNY